MLKNLDDAVAISRRNALGILAVGASAVYPKVARAICAAPREDGRWRNADAKGSPAFIDIKMVNCGDQVLNGQQTQTSYSMRCWVRQSNGQFYGRPTVKATYRSWNGKQWLVGKVPTGGYVDWVWARAEMRDGKNQMQVLIKHESLDSKPSAQSNYWFTRVN